VGPVYLFDLASRHASWASLRQTVITGNIANADVAGYVARDIERFDAVLDRTGLTMASTAPGHIGAAGAGSAEAGPGFEIRETDRPVSLDQELVRADEVSRAFALDTAVMRAFHRMLLSAVRTTP
jgi:flagellar basal-body rod protein FlgB